MGLILKDGCVYTRKIKLIDKRRKTALQDGANQGIFKSDGIPFLENAKRRK
jgi:hypothetical protein